MARAFGVLERELLGGLALDESRRDPAVLQTDHRLLVALADLPARVDHAFGQLLPRKLRADPGKVGTDVASLGADAMALDARQSLRIEEEYSTAFGGAGILQRELEIGRRIGLLRVDPKDRARLRRPGEDPLKLWDRRERKRFDARLDRGERLLADGSERLRAPVAKRRVRAREPEEIRLDPPRVRDPRKRLGRLEPRLLATERRQERRDRPAIPNRSERRQRGLASFKIRLLDDREDRIDRRVAAHLGERGDGRLPRGRARSHELREQVRLPELLGG